MIVAPRSRDISRLATVLDFAPGSMLPGFPLANVWDATDARKPARFWGVWNIMAGIDDKSNFNDGAARTATLNAGFYVGPAAYCAELARAHNAVSSNFYAYWSQDGTNRYRITLGRSAGTCSLQILSGADTADNCLKLVSGFSAEDRAAAASHTADTATIHGLSAQIALDFVTPHLFSGAILYDLDVSATATVYAQLGASNPAATEEYHANEPDADGALIEFTGSTAYRYALLTICNPRRTDKPFVGLGALWMGTWFDTDREGWSTKIEAESGSYAHALQPGRGWAPLTRKLGYPVISQVDPAETYTLAFQTAPGVDPADVPAYQALIRDLGTTGEAFVSAGGPLDGTVRLCRLEGMPQVTQAENGRYSVTFVWRVVA